MNSSDRQRQCCPFCEETFTEAKAMADHINAEHSTMGSEGK